MTAQPILHVEQAPAAMIPVGDELFYTVLEGASYPNYGVHRLYRRGTRGDVTRIDFSDGQLGTFGFEPYVLRAGSKTFLMTRNYLPNELFVLDERTSRATRLLPAGVKAFEGARPVAYNGLVYFVATERGQIQIPGGGGELWCSDGTPSGTVRVVDLNGGRDSDPHSLTVVGNVLYFVASTISDGTNQLWRTDGTSARTRLVKKLEHPVTDLTPHGHRLFFTSGPALGLGHVYVTDGSNAGTRVVGGAYDTTRSIASFVSAGSRLYFTASDAQAGREIWVTDLNGATARRVTDLEPGPVDGVKTFQNYIVARGEDLYVASGPGLDSTLGPPKPRVWWVGHDGRTVLLHDGRATALAAGAGKVYFISADNPYSGVYSTDGTRAGTHSIGLSATAFASAGADKLLYFTYYDGSIYRATPASAAAGGTVFNDMNGDRARHWSEPGLAGVRVFADLNGNGRRDEREPITRSDNSGRWHIDGLNAGSYTIRAAPVEQWTQTTATTPSLTLKVDHTASLDVGMIGAPAALAGTIFSDGNNNGTQDAGEGGAYGFRVFLDLNRSGKLDRDEPWTRTNSAGRYRFAGLSPGPYELRVTQAEGWRIKDNEWKRDVTVKPGTERRLNVAVRAFFQVRGLIYLDRNGNDQMDPFEGDQYTRVWIDLNHDGRVDDDEVVYGNREGQYWFREVPVGTYRLKPATLASDVEHPSDGYYTVSASRPTIFEGLDFRLWT
jgi:ELWxxDGT repeat protein